MRPPHADGRQYRHGRAVAGASGRGRGRGAGTVQLSDRTGAGADARRGGHDQPVARPPGPPCRPGRLFRGKTAAVLRGRSGPGRDRHRRPRGVVSGQPAVDGPHRRQGDPGVVGTEAGPGGVVGLCAQGFPVRIPQGAAGGIDRPARDAGSARCAQPPERLRSLCRLPRRGPGPARDRGRVPQLCGPAASQPDGRPDRRRPVCQ